MEIIAYRPVMHEGKPYVVTITPDADSKPSDADCFMEDDIRAWVAEQWRFVTVTVTGGHGHVASLSSVVYGVFNGSEITLDTLVAEDYYVPSLLRECRLVEVAEPVA